MMFLKLAALCIGGPLLAAWAHEYTHAVAAKLLGATVHTVDLVNLHVAFSFKGDKGVREELVYHAPTVVGALMLPILAFIWQRGAGPVPIIATLCWVIFTLNGGENEISVWSPVRFIRRNVHAFGQ